MKNSFVDYDEKSFEQFLKALLSEQNVKRIS
jgi:hypothetical protein